MAHGEGAFALNSLRKALHDVVSAHPQLSEALDANRVRERYQGDFGASDLTRLAAVDPSAVGNGPVPAGKSWRGSAPDRLLARAVASAVRRLAHVYFTPSDPGRATVLEVCSGNGVTTSEVRRALAATLPGARILPTDALVQVDPACEIEAPLRACDAVRKYAPEAASTVLVTHPSPVRPGNPVGADVEAVLCLLEVLRERPRPVAFIFVGEMGASDGTFGVYSWLMNHKDLVLISRDEYETFVDVFGRPSKKEVFVFVAGRRPGFCDNVRLANIESQPHLNGALATVVDATEWPDRVVVTVGEGDSAGVTIPVKANRISHAAGCAGGTCGK